MSHCRKHPDHKTETHCKLCLEPYCTECRSHRLFLCEGCMYKVLIMLLVALIIVFYVAFVGIL